VELAHYKRRDGHDPSSQSSLRAKTLSHRLDFGLGFHSFRFPQTVAESEGSAAMSTDRNGLLSVPTYQYNMSTSHLLRGGQKGLKGKFITTSGDSSSMDHLLFQVSRIFEYDDRIRHAELKSKR